MAPERPTVAVPKEFHPNRLIPLELLQPLALRGIAKFFPSLTRTAGLLLGNATRTEPRPKSSTRCARHENQKPLAARMEEANSLHQLNPIPSVVYGVVSGEGAVAQLAMLFPDKSQAKRPRGTGPPAAPDFTKARPPGRPPGRPLSAASSHRSPRPAPSLSSSAAPPEEAGPRGSG